MSLVNSITLLLLMMLALSCGGNGSGNKANTEMAMEPIRDGIYHAVLRPFNTHASGFLPTGTATFTVEGDELNARTLLDDDARVNHRQSIHFGSRCPTMSDDGNGDGFVDYEEAISVVKGVLLPLDGDLNSQDAGKDIYPRGSSFTYLKSASVTKIETDLWQEDENPEDEVKKTESGKEFGINQKVVLIHGVASFVNLPASVRGRGEEKAHLSLPIACGVISKVN